MRLISLVTMILFFSSDFLCVFVRVFMAYKSNQLSFAQILRTILSTGLSIARLTYIAFVISNFLNFGSILFITTISSKFLN